jgi:tetratricopeptide (TPR) repeat protein
LISVAGDQYDKKDFAGALETYNLFLSHYSHHPLINAARLGKGWALEASGKTDDALAAFLAAGTANPTDSYSPAGLIEAARIYKNQNKFAEARQVLNDCIRISSTSYYGQVAKERLSEIPAA